MEGINYKVFVSGHRDLTKEEFNSIYIPAINKYIDWLKEDHSHIFDSKKLTFYVGDCEGCDKMTIYYLCGKLNRNIKLVICSLKEKFEGQINYDLCINDNISVIKEFNTHEERDAYMTKNTDIDLLYIRPNKWDSGTAQNFVRRVWMPK